MQQAGAFTELIEALRGLPGVGPRAAQRIACQLLTTDKPRAARLGNALLNAVATVGRCPRCNNLTDLPLCGFCTAKGRDDSLLCVVESVADMVAIEQSLSWSGRYFVLMGRLSPLSGTGPVEIGLEKLIQRAGEPEVEEVVVATSFTAEGEATALAISEALARHYPDLRVTRIARGVPAGTEIEYTDLNTIAQAVLSRRVRENP